MQIGELFYKITGDTSGLDKSLKKTDAQVKTAGKGLSGLGGILKGAAFAGAAVFAAKKVVELGGSLITAASDAEETRNKFSVVFRDVADEAAAAAESLSDNFGLSSKAAQTLLADTGDLLTGFGFTGESALDLSTQVNELAVDLASFTNFSGGAEGASQALTKALLGERESVKALGISILETDVQKQVAINTAKGLTFETERQAKAQATLDIALAQSKNAIGDFERSSDSFANQQRIAAAAVDDLKVALGESLLPTATASVRAIGSITKSLAEFLEERNKLAAEKSNFELAAQGQGDAIKAYNDQLNLINRVKDARANDRTELMKLAREYDFNIRKLDEWLMLQENDLKVSKRNADAQQARIDGQNALAKALEEEAKAEEERQEKQRKYIEFIESEYKDTEQGKIEQLQEEIDLIERNKDAYGGLAEEQQILIDLKTKEIEKLLEKEAVEDEALTKTQEYHQALIDLNTITAEDEIAIQKAKNEEIARSEAELYAARFLAAQTFFGGISALANSFAAQTKNQFLAQQAFSSAEAAINSYLAFTQVLADPSFIGRPFLRATAAAGALAAGLAQQVKILSTPMPAFANGGIVAGSSFSGDNITARVNSGEMVLNREQQKQLFNLANGEGGGNQTIVIKIGNTDFAKAVVNSVNSGAGGVVDARVVR